MTIYKLSFPKSEVNRNEIVGIACNCTGINEAQERYATPRGLPLSDFFVTKHEWNTIYSPAAQKRNLEGTQSGVRGDMESWEIVELSHLL
tara:strand:+ start:551 stop:820 length:270 start_codon:yes stop_codon:yes gene_type:complete